MTDFLQNPALLMGIPLVVVGIIGIGMILGVAFTQWLHPS